MTGFMNIDTRDIQDFYVNLVMFNMVAVALSIIVRMVWWCFTNSIAVFGFWSPFTILAVVIPVILFTMAFGFMIYAEWEDGFQRILPLLPMD
mgnify:CR=1 FL=1